MSFPSITRSAGTLPPARAANVGKMSSDTAIALLVDPAGIRPGQRARKQTRCPPSHVSPFPPRSGALLAPWRTAPPLSEVNMTSVFSSIPSSLSFAKICPVDQSISSTVSPHFPFLDFPAKSSEAYCGQCGMVCGRYRKKGPSLFRSMNSRASSV